MPAIPSTSSSPIPPASSDLTSANPSQAFLTLGHIVRKDLEASLLSSSTSRGSPSTDFLEELERDEKPKPFQVSADTVATGRTCVIGSSGCIPEYEYFYTKNGVTQVSEIYEGMVSHLGYISNIEKKKDKIYRLTLRGYGRGDVTFVASAEHPILVSLPGGKGKIPRGRHYGHKRHERQRWITLGELFSRQHRFAYARVEDSQVVEVNSVSFGKELAKLFGYLLSDGSWAERRSVEFTSVQENLLQDAENLSRNFGLITKRYQQGNAYALSITRENGHDRFSNHHLLLDSISNLEMSNRSDTFGKLQLLETGELVEFLKGYFNCNGSIRVQLAHSRLTRAKLSSLQMSFYVGKSRRQAIELQFMLWRLGIYSSVKFRNRVTGPKGHWQVSVCQPSVKLAARLLKDLKHPEIFDRIISEPDPLENNLGVSSLSGKNWLRITKVEYLGEDTVVGWESSFDHQIISYGGLVTHNSGKSYTVGVLCEELCKAKVPFVLIDIEGEYSGLKEKYDAIWVGDEEASDLKWSSLNPSSLAQYAPDCPALILDLSGTDKPREKVASFLMGVYKEISKRRTPYLVILEEADRFVPQVGERLRIFDEVARRGRKRGLGLVFCTQRPSVVDKNILSQCANQLIGKLVIRNDLQSVAQFFSSHGLPNQLTTLAPGEFYALGGLSSEPVCVKIRERETRHGGMTPKLNPAAVHPSIEKLVEAMAGAPRQASDVAQDAMPSQDSKTSREDEEEIPNSSVAPKAEKMSSEELPAPPKMIGFAPTVEQSQVPLFVKPSRSFKVFAEKENVTKVDLVFRPLVEVAVTTRRGLIKKKFGTQYFYLDGITGEKIEGGERLSLREGVGKLIGLSEGQIVVLRMLEPDSDQSAIDVGSKAKMLDDQARRILKELEEKRLVRSSKLGRAKMYRRLIDIPKIDLSKDSQVQRMVDLTSFSDKASAAGGSFQNNRLDESKLRELVKGLWEGVDLESFKVFYYPIYRVELFSKNGTSRTILLDGTSGKEVTI